MFRPGFVIDIMDYVMDYVPGQKKRPDDRLTWLKTQLGKVEELPPLEEEDEDDEGPPPLVEWDGDTDEGPPPLEIPLGQ